MQETVPPTKAEHTVTITDRAQISMSGIEEVDSYDAGGILMRSAGGDLVVRGEGLRIKSFDRASGRLLIEGKLTELQYADRPEKGASLLGRLFG